MRKFLSTPLIGVLALTSSSIFAQQPKSSIESDKRHYEQAYTEIADMLDGKRSLSIKRAVFLAEWAYYDGMLDYDNYCNTINKAIEFLTKFISANNLNKYKTGHNMALVEYFFNPYSGNDNTPFTYDFKNESLDEDFTCQFVTRVMQTHKGQCRSLPMYYKILAEAIGAEAYIVYLPRHTFIRYRNYDKLYPEDWVNVELTTHQIVPESFYREQHNITDSMMESKLYLHPLSDIETVAAQLADLALGYWQKYKVYDEFTLRCVEKSLKYRPQSANALIIKGNSICEMSGGKEMKNQDIIRQLQNIKQTLDDLGWVPMSAELKTKIEDDYRQTRKAQNNQ